MMIFGYFRRPGFQISSVDGSLCVCVALLMALLALSDGFFFFFLNMGFCFAGILVSSGQW